VYLAGSLPGIIGVFRPHAIVQLLTEAVPARPGSQGGRRIGPAWRTAPGFADHTFARRGPVGLAKQDGRVSPGRAKLPDTGFRALDPLLEFQPQAEAATRRDLFGRIPEARMVEFL